MVQFPIGIDPERFTNALERPDVKGYIEELKHEFSGRKVLYCTNLFKGDF